ncbi:hypothetical protein CDL12_01334 [Handroanthus impetiginosus]|uniref:KIB1-4 beta-propeller domain-containing protein n=1 Tax=Handroanthus impetiginosus TaxID=429701 RepID=A0A2G9I8F5_9LAMI|nr:hypothetical protein CDL12_01334 [Handroanthus impetiginosus]
MADEYEAGNNESSYSCLPPPDCNKGQPWLVVSHGQQLQRQSFYTILKHRYMTRIIPDMRNKQVLPTSFGWLALIDVTTQECCLMNMSSMDKIQLPRLGLKSIKNRYFRCTLSKPPGDPDCHVLLVSTTQNLLLFCRIGDEKFVSRRNAFQDDKLAATTNFQGKIYAWMSKSSNLVTLDFAGNDVWLDTLGNDNRKGEWPLSSNSSPWDYELMESYGKLLMVQKIYSFGEIIHFKIFKIDPSVMACEELQSIGNRNIFLSNFGSMCVSASGCWGMKDNLIYFTLSNDKNLYAYDIEDHSKTFYMPCNIAKRGALKFWIMI